MNKREKERKEYIDKIKKMTNEELVNELLSKFTQSNYWPDDGYYMLDMYRICKEEVLKRMGK